MNAILVKGKVKEVEFLSRLKAVLIVAVMMISLTGCSETVAKDDAGNTKTEFSAFEVATVNDTKIKINSVKKIMNECAWEYDGECQSYTEPDNDYFLVIDLTIENTGDDELAVSSMMSFELKDENGEKGGYTFMLDAVSSQLDGSVMPGDLLKGQIAFDVKDSNTYNFYYLDSLLDDKIKFVINQSDIEEA